MRISFASRKLKKICEDERGLQKAHGKGCARKIKTRLTDLEAAANLEVMRNLPGRCHELTKDRSGQLALDLDDGKRLVFRPAIDPAPAKQDGGLDWFAVEAIEILEITDYH